MSNEEWRLGGTLYFLHVKLLGVRIYVYVFRKGPNNLTI